MITRPTTLILGAGASAPFGFPTGYELLRQVINIADIHPGRTNAKLFSDFKHEEILLFQDALRRSGKTSVDAFLEHRAEFIRIGKIAIAIALIQHEHEPHLFQRDGNSWYEYLFNQLNAPFEEFHKNRLSILTFNYDRSLEHFLFTALRNSSGKSTKECADKIASIKILHLHGDLGALPFTNAELARPYDTNITESALEKATERIKIVHEGISENPQFQEACQILQESEVICFLGFGFHPLNMKRLKFDKPNHIDCFRSHVQIIGSSYGLTAAECSQLSQYAGINLRRTRALAQSYSEWDCLRFLREVGAYEIR